MKSIDQWGETVIELSDFVQKLDESVRSEAFKFLLSQEANVVSAPPSPLRADVPRAEGARAVAPQELIRKSGGSSFMDKAVVLAYWLEHHQQKETFSSGDLKAAFEQAREPAPKNVSDLVAKLEVAARIMKAEGTGSIQTYRLTSSAIEFVEGRLNPNLEQKL